MERQATVKGIRHNKVYVLRIGLMHVSYSMYFYDLLLFVIYVSSLDKLADLLMYSSLSCYGSPVYSYINLVVIETNCGRIY